MKHLLAIILITASIGSAMAQRRQFDSSERIISNLNRMETLYFKYLSYQERQEAIQLLNEIRNLVVNANGNPNLSKENRRWQNQNTLSEEGYQALLASVKNEMIDEEKTIVVLTACKNGRITCSQLEGILALYTFDNYREDLIHRIFDNIVDPVNIGLIINHFDNPLKRDELQKWILSRQ